MEESFREVTAKLLTIKDLLEEVHEREIAKASGLCPSGATTRETTTVAEIKAPDTLTKVEAPAFIQNPSAPEDVPAMIPFVEDGEEDAEEVWQDDTSPLPVLPHSMTEESDYELQSDRGSTPSPGREAGRRITVQAIVKNVTDKFEQKAKSSEKVGHKRSSELWQKGFHLANKAADVAAHFDKTLHEVEFEEIFKLLDHWILDDEHVQRIRAKRNLLHRSHTPSKSTHKIQNGEENETGIDDDDDDELDDEIFTVPSRGFSLFFQKDDSNPVKKDCQCIHPQSRPRLCWDLASLVFFTYDIIFIPMMVFDLGDELKFCDLFVAIYWTLDIFWAFSTGVYVGGVLIRSPSLVAKQYAKTWMPLDVSLVTLDWFSLLTDSFGVFGLARALRGGRFIKIIRVLRLVRLLRIIKVKRVLSEMHAKSSSPAAVLFLSISKLLCIGLLMAHSLACLWYAVGNASSQGWVYVENMEHESLLERYIVSFQHGLGRLHPSNMANNMTLRTRGERMLAILATLIALVFSSLFVSSITTTMGDLSRLRSQRFRSKLVLNEYISLHRISHTLARQARRWLEKENAKQFQTHLDADLLEILPVDLMTAFRLEAWAPVLIRHPLFNMLHVKHPRTESAMCYQALSEVHHHRGTQVFTTGDQCTRMLFTISGNHYYKAGKDYDSWLKLQQRNGLRRPSNSRRGSSMTIGEQNVDKMDVGPGLWLCEAVIYTHWQYCGDLKAVTDVTLLAVSAEEVAAVAKKHEQAFVDIAIYAQCFLEELNRVKGKISDLPNLVQVNQEDFVDAQNNASFRPDSVNTQGIMPSLT